MTRLHCAAVLAAVVTGSFGASSDQPWMDASKSPDERVALLLPVMSLAEKVNQLLHVWTTVHDADVIRVYGNTSVGAMYIAHLATNMTCDASPGCRLAARNRLQKNLIEQSAHHIPISFITESLHSPMMANPSGRSRSSRASLGTTPCQKAIATACPKLTGAACKACVAKHSAAVIAACPTPGQVDAACGAEAGHVMGSIFPMPAGQGSTWNRSMVRAVAAAIAVESRASGADRGFSPELQVATDPRFGRTQENFGGDPHLVSELGVAATLGLHGGETGGPGSYLPDYTTTITSEAKHYAVYGFGDADGSPADVSIPTLYDVYLRPWKAYVRAGRPCHSSKWLLTDVFRTELGCDKCLIGTDFRDIELLSDMNTANTSRYPGLPADTDASLQSLAAGVDQDLGGFSYNDLDIILDAPRALPPTPLSDSFRFSSLLPASAAGLMPAPTKSASHGIDEACANVLRAKFAAGLFDHPFTDPALLDTIDSKAHRAVARAAAIDGATLLQNRGGVLPQQLSKLGKVAVVGPLAGCHQGATLPCAAQKAMAGGYFPDPSTSQIITVAEALANRLSPGSLEVVVNTGDDNGVAAAAAAAKSAGFAVVVVGDTASSCGESSDRMELDLIDNQLDLLEAVLATGVPTLTVLIHGRPATFGGSPNAKWAGGANQLLGEGAGGHAVLSIWRPGQEGGEAVADIVLGVAQPGGRLAQPWPRSVGYVHSRAAPWWNLHQGDYDWGNKYPEAGVADNPWALADGQPWSPLFSLCSPWYPHSSEAEWCSQSDGVPNPFPPSGFGHGTAYSNYTFSRIAVSGSVRAGRSDGAVAAAGAFTVKVTVSDLAAYTPEGAAVVQVYAAPLSASRTGQVRYKKTLVGFTKANIAADGETEVEVDVRADELGYTVFDPMAAGADNHPWVVESGQYRLLACRSECDCQLDTTVTVL